MRNKKRKAVTKVGLITYLLLITTLFGKDIIPIAFPNSALSNLMNLESFTIFWWVLCFVVILIVQVILGLYGYPSWKENNQTLKERSEIFRILNYFRKSNNHGGEKEFNN